MTFRGVLWAAACWALTGPCQAAEQASLQASPITADTVADFFDTAFAVQQQDHRIAGAVVAVVHRGETIFLGGYGYADIQRRQDLEAEIEKL